MKRLRRLKKTSKALPTPTESTNIDKYESLDEQQELLEIQKGLVLNRAITSNSPVEILRAKKFLNQRNSKSSSKGQKSFIFDPDHFNDNLGYKEKRLDLTYNMLRAMGRTSVMKPIVSTRTDQIKRYDQATLDDQKMGWTIKKKQSLLFPDKEKDLASQEKYEIEGLIEFVQNGGVEKKEWVRDSFGTFLSKIIPDSLTLDQCTFEIVQTRALKPYEYFATDGASYRLAPSYKNQRFTAEQVPIMGHYPYYVQLRNGLVNSEFYPWELCFGVRNPQTNIYNNGYGISELEDMVRQITWLLQSAEHNGRFFSNGAASKGFFFVKGEVDPDVISEFKQAWRSQITGIENSWKTPMLENVEDMEFVDLTKSNRDMEFQNWMNFLILLHCAHYRIDPSEIGFHSLTSNGQGTSIYEGIGNNYKLKFSRDKGLYPLMNFLGKSLDKYIVSRFYGGKYQFSFSGMEESIEDSDLEKDIKKLEAGIWTWGEIRQKYSLDSKVKDGDFLLNSMWMQYQQMKMGMLNNESNEAVEGLEDLNVEGEEQDQEMKQNIFDSVSQNYSPKGTPKFDNNIFEGIKDQMKSKTTSNENIFAKDLNSYMDNLLLHKR